MAGGKEVSTKVIQIDVEMYKCSDVWKEGNSNGWIDRQIDGWIDRWMDRWIDRQVGREGGRETER
jgi:hypothetical protein